jgi:hypothetical protein
MIAKVVSLSHKIRSTCLQTFDEINKNCVIEKKIDLQDESYKNT